VPIPPDRIVDVDGRDPERTPMQWDGTHAAGFTTGEPWLPLAGDADRVNVAAQSADPGSILQLYRRLIRLRRGSEALRRGAYRSVASPPPGVFAFERAEAPERVLVALNFSDRERAFAIRGMSEGRLLLSTRHDRPPEGISMRPLELGPREGVVVRA
jgi:alpha-glucosidase